MSKASRRPTREARNQHKEKRREAQRTLQARRAAQGEVGPSSVSNRLCKYCTEAEEQAAHEEAVASQLGVFRGLLPKLLRDLSTLCVRIIVTWK